MIRTLLLWFFISYYLPCCSQTFPQWRGSNILLPGTWTQSPIVAIGDITHVVSYGEQIFDHDLPWPMAAGVRKLFWCEGLFKGRALIKGELDLTRDYKYLWASASPGCRLWYGDMRVFDRFLTRAWLFRKEGEFIRPIYDGGAPTAIRFFTAWHDNDDEPPSRTFGALLLTPTANSDTLDQFAKYLWEVGDIACELLGRSVCVTKLKRLAMEGNTELHDAACNFLKGQLEEDCEP